MVSHCDKLFTVLFPELRFPLEMMLSSKMFSVVSFALTEIKACDNSPCLNSVMCTDTPGGNYYCTCLAGYEGTNCGTGKGKPQIDV